MTTMTASKIAPPPWYKQGWPWFLIAIPFTAVIMGVIMINLAVNTDDGLVVDDYYWRGKQINQVLERDHRATQLRVDARLSVDPEQHRLRLQIVELNATAPDTLELQFLHATRAGLDQTLTLTLTGRDVYTADLPDLPPGRWDLQLSGGDWRVMGSLKTPDQRAAALTADR